MCIFCKIIQGEIPNKTVLEDDNFLAFEDINPQAPVHLLVIPKLHVESFEDIGGDLMAQMTIFIQKVTSHLNLENGYRLVTNIGEDGCQEVKHLHFHILAGRPIGPLVCK
jgi:histidine triad (HIT) family protein